MSKTIKMNSRTIGDVYAIVDDEDFEFLNKWKWHVRPDRNTFYAQRTDCSMGRKTVHMHRLIMNVKDKTLQVDHINHNGLDNRKVNLRICSQKSNSKNRTSARLSTSKYLGVCFKKPRDGRRGGFAATIKFADKNENLGLFQLEIDAAFAYNKAAIKHHKEFANINILNRQIKL